jgi:hypothetical protein
VLVTGYDDPNHWCYITLKKFWKCPSETGLPMVIGRDPKTDEIVCYGENSTVCDMDMDDARCDEFLRAFNSSASYRSCGLLGEGMLQSTSRILIMIPHQHYIVSTSLRTGVTNLTSQINQNISSTVDTVGSLSTSDLASLLNSAANLTSNTGSGSTNNENSANTAQGSSLVKQGGTQRGECVIIFPSLMCLSKF